MTTDDQLRASRVIRAWRSGRNGRLPIPVEVLAEPGVAKSDQTRAAGIIRDMADDPEAPIIWNWESKDLVTLDWSGSRDLEDWVREWVTEHADERYLPVDLR